MSTHDTLRHIAAALSIAAVGLLAVAPPAAGAAGAPNLALGLGSGMFAKTDFNGDGRADIVWRHPVTGHTAVWLMDGGQVIGSALLVADPAWEAVATPDLDGDGKSDIVWHHAGNNWWAVWLMNGTAMRTSAALSIRDSRLVATLDLNGDGKSDLFWINGLNNQKSVGLMNGLAQIGWVDYDNDPNYVPWGFADVNGDGRSDRIYLQADRNWLNIAITNTGKLGIWGLGSGWQVDATPDLNGDRRADLLWHNRATGQWSVWLLDGACCFSIAVLAQSTLSSDPAWVVIGTPDLDGDGKADLLWYHAGSGSTAAWLMDGVAPRSTAVLATLPDWTVIATRDFNGDGKADLLWRNAVTGQVAVWLMNGTTLISAVILPNDPAWVPVF